MISYHTIPVPRHMDPESAWAEISVMGELVGYSRLKPRFWRMGWAVIEVDDG